MATILIVHAHPEPQSFSSALARTARETFAAQGHQVLFSDLYALQFDPVSDRRNFTAPVDPHYFKQQQEELHASEHAGFAPEIALEIGKLERCDFLLFSFPLWWFGMPAMLKGWVDRVCVYGRIYGQGRWYQTGLAAGKQAKAMVVTTTGSGAALFGDGGPHPSLETLLTPIHHGVFRFNGFSPLPPFVAWSAAHGSDADRQETLHRWRERLQGVLAESPAPGR